MWSFSFLKKAQMSLAFLEIGENRQLFIAIVVQRLLLFNHSQKSEYQIFSSVQGLFGF